MHDMHLLALTCRPDQWPCIACTAMYCPYCYVLHVVLCTCASSLGLSLLQLQFASRMTPQPVHSSHMTRSNDCWLALQVP